MEQVISNGLLIEFHNEINTQIQQRIARLKPYVDIIPINGEFKYLDDMGGVEFELNNQVFATTRYDQEVEYHRRKLSTNRYLCDRPIDLNIKSEQSAKEQFMMKLADQIAAAAARKVDKVLIEAIEANATDNANNSISFATDGGITVNATAGFTFDQFMNAKRQLMQQGWGIDEETGLLFLTTEQERITLESETEISSADYAKGYGVVKDTNGDLKRLRGVDLLTYPSAPQHGVVMLPVASSIRSNYMLNTKGRGSTSGALVIGIQKDFNLEIVEAKETRHDTLLLKGSIKMGATRQANSGIVKITTTVL